MGDYEAYTARQQQLLADFKADHEVRVRESRRYETASRVLASWNEQTHSVAFRRGSGSYGPEVMAAVAVELADALLAALEIKS